MTQHVRLCSRCSPPRVEQFGKAGLGACQGCQREDYLSSVHLESLLLLAHNPETEQGRITLARLANLGFRHSPLRCNACGRTHMYKLATVGPPWRGVLQSPEEYAVHFGVTVAAARNVFSCPDFEEPATVEAGST